MLFELPEETIAQCNAKIAKFEKEFWNNLKSDQDLIREEIDRLQIKCADMMQKKFEAETNSVREQIRIAADNARKLLEK